MRTATRTTVFLVLAAFLAGSVFGLAIGFGKSVADALVSDGEEARAAGGAVDSNGSMIAISGDGGSGNALLWLVDTETKRISVYKSTLGKNIEWVGSRNAEWDFKVEGYHDDSALPAEQMRRRWEQHALRKPIEEATPVPEGGKAHPGGGEARDR